jgi:hypothetical protein
MFILGGHFKSVKLKFYCNGKNRGFKTLYSQILKVKSKGIGGTGYFGNPTTILVVCVIDISKQQHLYLSPYSESMPILLSC